MASSEKNLSSFSKASVSDIGKKVFAIIVSEWNEEVTEAMYQGAFDTLRDNNVPKENIIRVSVPGSYELTLAAQWMAQQDDVDAVICIGCVIQGETRHFDFICDAVAQGIKDINLKFDKPIIFGVLTPENQQQALDRAGGIHGNKGDEAAITAVKMLGLQKKLFSSK